MVTELLKRTDGLSSRERITGWPDWWNKHGLQMEVVDSDITNHQLVLKGGETASLKFSLTENGDWNLDWEIVHNFPAGEKAGGRVCMDKESVKDAFSLSTSSRDPLVNQALIMRFGADSGRFGKYIRKGPYLNIPGPGVGYIGDPNLSVYITNKISTVVKALIVLAE